MTDRIRAKFEQLHPNKQGSNQRLREALYAVFKEGWENGKGEVEKPSQPRLGYFIYTVDCDDWGCKMDGYMVGFTIEDLEKRRVDYEARNNCFGGQYYERPNNYFPIELTPEAVEKLEAAVDSFNCVWFYKSINEFKKGGE